MPGGPKFNADPLVLAHLAAGESVKDTALKCAVSEETVYRRLRDKKFRERLRRCREEYLRQTLGVLAAASVEASAKLRGLVSSSSSERIQLDAAKTLLDAERRYVETEQLRAEVEELREKDALREKQMKELEKIRQQSQLQSSQDYQKMVEEVEALKKLHEEMMQNEPQS